MTADRWKNRRRMAWIAFWAALAYPALLIFADPSNVVALAPHFYLFVGSVVGLYIGFATYDDKWQKNES